MKLFNERKTIDRLNRMIDNALKGEPVEQGFDESRLSALETRLSDFLSMNSATKSQLAEEKAKINELISDISHQTKTPLANILLYTQLLEAGGLGEHNRDLFKALTEQTEKLNFLISTLVKTSRLETGIIVVAPKTSKIPQLIDQVMSQSISKAEEKEITLTADTSDLSAVFDLKWTAEALCNIVDNGIKYNKRGGSIHISVTAYQLFCRVDVTDTGIGITEEEAAKIFLRFYRSQDVRDMEGLGIGLYLSREIISNQGGYIKVTSKPDKGSTFSIFLPVHT